MEKAMEQSHGMNYAEYERNFSNRMLVEKRREVEYEKSKRIIPSAILQKQR